MLQLSLNVHCLKLFAIVLFFHSAITNAQSLLTRIPEIDDILRNIDIRSKMYVPRLDLSVVSKITNFENKKN